MTITRQQYKDAGLVEFRAWVTPVQKECMERMLISRTNLLGLEVFDNVGWTKSGATVKMTKLAEPV